MRPTRHRVSLLFVYGGFHGWVTESYSGENVGHRPGERAAVLHRATIGITEIAIRFQNEITLAATITPRPRTMRDDRRPPTSGIVPNCPLPHESVLALFQLMLICAILPDFTPVTVPYCDLIKVWVTESYCSAIQQPCAVE